MVCGSHVGSVGIGGGSVELFQQRGCGSGDRLGFLNGGFRRGGGLVESGQCVVELK